MGFWALLLNTHFFNGQCSEDLGHCLRNSTCSVRIQKKMASVLSLLAYDHSPSHGHIKGPALPVSTGTLSFFRVYRNTLLSTDVQQSLKQLDHSLIKNILWPKACWIFQMVLYLSLPSLMKNLMLWYYSSLQRLCYLVNSLAH